MKLKKQKPAVYRVQALERALDILDCFTFETREMGLSDIAERTGLNKTTAKRLIWNLTARGYLQQAPEAKRYTLGIRLFELGGIVFSSFSLRKVAAYHMTNLQKETGFSVVLGVKMDEQLVYVDKREGSGVIRISSDIGWRKPLHFGMLGMVLMAYLNPKDVKRILKKIPLEPYTPYSITDEDAFIRRLEQIYKEGHLVDREEAVEGAIGIAAPIRDYTRQVIAALGVALPASRGNKEKEVDRVVELLKKTCDDISGDLGYLKK